VIRSEDVDVGFGHCQPRVRVSGNVALKFRYGIMLMAACLNSLQGREKSSYDTRAPDKLARTGRHF